jgi:hypothetical protein
MGTQGRILIPGRSDKWQDRPHSSKLAKRFLANLKSYLIHNKIIEHSLFLLAKS